MGCLSASIRSIQDVPNKSGAVGIVGILIASSALCRNVFSRLRGRIYVNPLSFQLLQKTVDLGVHLIHLLYLFSAPIELLLHHHNQRLSRLMWSIEVEKMVGVDKEVSQVLYL